MGEKSIIVLRRSLAAGGRAGMRGRSGPGVAEPTRRVSGILAGRDALWSETIAGEPVPAIRLHDVLLLDGRPRLIRSHAARLWLNRALQHLRNRRPSRPFTGPLSLECRFWLAGARARVDETLVLEILERAGIVAHGIQIQECHSYVARDVAAPRAEILLRRAGDVV